MKKLLFSIGLLGLLTLPVMGAGEIQYESQTLVNLADVRWITGTQTNFAAAANLTKSDQVTLEFVTKLTNAATGTITVRWSYSADGVNYPSVVDGNVAGWFAIPLTNHGQTSVFITNLSVGNIGYYRIDNITNNAVQHISNFTAKAWFKPQRSGNQE